MTAELRRPSIRLAHHFTISRRVRNNRIQLLTSVVIVKIANARQVGPDTCFQKFGKSSSFRFSRNNVDGKYNSSVLGNFSDGPRTLARNRPTLGPAETFKCMSLLATATLRRLLALFDHSCDRPVATVVRRVSYKFVSIRSCR